MARSTRQQRRQRRAQAAGKPPLRPAPRPRPAEEETEMESAEPRRERRERSDDVRPGIPGVRFVQEAIAELRKVEWPNQHAVISGTAVVIISSIIVGVYLWANDELWRFVVHHLLLR